MPIIARDILGVDRTVRCNDKGELIVQITTSGNVFFPFYYEGSAVINEYIFDGLLFPQQSKVTKIWLSTRETPDTVDFKVTLFKGSTTTGKVAQITAGSLSEITDIVDETFQTTETCGLKITQVGNDDTPTAIHGALYFEEV